MPTLVVLVTSDATLADEWELQLPPGSIAERFLQAKSESIAVPGPGTIVVLDACVEKKLPSAFSKCVTVFVGEPRSTPFEEARFAHRAKAYLSYEESRQRLRELFPLLEEIAEKQSLLEMISDKSRRTETIRTYKKGPTVDATELWDFIEGVVEALDNRERLIAEFRRASRYVLRASHAVFFFREADGFRADRGTSFFAGDDPLVRYFESHPAVIDGTSWDGPADPVAELAVRSRLALWGSRLLIPVHDNGRLLGLIALGVRDDGEQYDHVDRLRAVSFARLLRGLLLKAVQIARLNHIAGQAALGAKYLPGTLVLGPEETAPRHVPLVVRDLVGQTRRTREISRASPCVGQPFRASAGIVAETGGVWAAWEEASGEVHDLLARERAGRRDLLLELALTLSHEIGNSLVSLVTFRQSAPEKILGSPLVEMMKRDVIQLEALNRNVEVMQRLHEVEVAPCDIRDLAQRIGDSSGLRVEVGPEPVLLNGNERLLEFALISIIQAVAESRRDEGLREVVLKVRSTGTGGDLTALVSLKGKDLELEGILPEPVENPVPNQGRIAVFLAKEIIRLHHGEIHAGPGLECIEILIAIRKM